MATALYLLAGILLFTFLLLSIPLEIRLRYGREGERDQLGLYLLFWPSLGFRLRVFMLDFKTSLRKPVLYYRAGQEKGGGTGTETKKIVLPDAGEIAGLFLFWKDVLSRISPALNYFKSKLIITGLTWKTLFGFGDPFYTGMAAGIIWSAKGFLVSALYGQLKAAKAPALEVVPDFNRDILSAHLDFRLSTRAGYAVIAGLRVLATLLLNGQARDTLRMIRTMSRKYAGTSKSKV